MILILFFFSGVTALIYEVVWSKYLTLLFGSTVYAQTTVLAVFMGGLALGSWLFGAWSHKTKYPLRAYGFIEIGIGLYAFLFTVFYGFTDQVFTFLGSKILEHRMLLLFLKGILSACLLLIPTTLMGGTLPLLAAWLQNKEKNAGRWSVRFYSVNTLGAVIGACLASFFMIRFLGMSMTLWFTALANVLIGLTILALARSYDSLQIEDHPLELPKNSSSSATPCNWVWLCGLVAFTGGISMGLEILASRFLSLIFGASLQAFGVVLIAFILGIGIAGSLASSSRWKNLNLEKTAMVLLLGTGVLLSFLILSAENWVCIYHFAKSGFAQNNIGYFYYLLFITLISILVLGIPACLLGTVLPLCIRSVDHSTGFGNRVGWLLSWNTCGAVIGVILTGFIFMPNLGLRNSLITFALILSLFALSFGWVKRFWKICSFSIVLIGLLVWFSRSNDQSWRSMMSFGVFRVKGTETHLKNVLDERKQYIQMLFYEDAADATVSVEANDEQRLGTEISLRINGKADASVPGDLSTQYLLAHLPMLARPESKDVFVLGFGSGITAGAFLGHPVEKLVICENCAPVLKAGSFFKRWNRDVLYHPLTRVWQEDARTILKLSSQKYDIIVSEPSNPWTVGIGSVFSREFYELASSRLKEKGIMTQWFHLYEMSDEIVDLILRTFASVFPFFEIWDSHSGDIILLGSKTPWDSHPGIYQKIFERPFPRKDLSKIGLTTPESIWARQLASQETTFAIPNRGFFQSDEIPILEYDAPKAFYIGGFSKFLMQFDERGWQSDMASARKHQVLSSLDEVSLKKIFENAPSVNSDLRKTLSLRFLSQEKNLNVLPEHNRTPWIFWPHRATNELSRISDQKNDERQSLLQAESLIYSNPSQWRAGVEIIESILQAPKSFQTIEWLSNYFAALAVRTCIKQGELKQARKIILLGFLLDPHSRNLQYLGKIIIRRSSTAVAKN